MKSSFRINKWNLTHLSIQRLLFLVFNTATKIIRMKLSRIIPCRTKTPGLYWTDGGSAAASLTLIFFSIELSWASVTRHFCTLGCSLSIFFPPTSYRKCSSSNVLFEASLQLCCPTAWSHSPRSSCCPWQTWSFSYWSDPETLDRRWSFSCRLSECRIELRSRAAPLRAGANRASDNLSLESLILWWGIWTYDDFLFISDKLRPKVETVDMTEVKICLGRV